MFHLHQDEWSPPKIHPMWIIFNCHSVQSSSYSKRELEWAFLFFIPGLVHPLPQSPQIIISPTFPCKHIAINKSWPGIGGNNSSSHSNKCKSLVKKEPISDDIPILKLYYSQLPNWLPLHHIPSSSSNVQGPTNQPTLNSCRLSMGLSEIFLVVINHLSWFGYK